MRTLTLFLGLVLPFAGGCSRTETVLTSPQPAQTWRDIAQRIEQGKYTTYHSQPHIVLVREVQELFRHKEAYPWLIKALEGPDELVRDTIAYELTPLNIPGGMTSASLCIWYSSVPENELVWNGYLWKPRLPE